MFVELLKYSFIYAMIAVAYIVILSKEPILNWWFKFGLKFEDEFFWKPLFGCEKCFAGQLSFWIFIFNWISSEMNLKPFNAFINFTLIKYHNVEYSITWLIFSVSTTVIITLIISKIINKIKTW